MMYQTDTFGLATILEVNCQILEMPYKGKELSMVILLPQEIEDDSTGLVRLEIELTYEKLIEWTQPDVMKSIEIDLALPKFKMEETYSLKDILVSLGMKDALRCVQKQLLWHVSQQWTGGVQSGAQVLCGDHPFLFFIRHNPTQSILFYGRPCSP
ncbi:hypothetical protein SKAU_G00071130 [Synaphobranchus kaupii]|uniref:Serpin domain-containing protein n=1 Tax=Synaphobranchus kaupii TaxID=118154 RepID=A0A9Q1JBA6_SYNKA|nr:hypothetical protein SKAU_G00071130 [Synaphobranchus kaupii]